MAALPPLTAAGPWIAAYALLLVALGVPVGLMRLKRVKGERLDRAVRVHGNAAENLPTFGLLLIGLDLMGSHPLLVHGLGAAFLAARVGHAYGLSRSMGPSAPRFLGIVLTWTLQAVAAGLLLLRALGGPG